MNRGRLLVGVTAALWVLSVTLLLIASTSPGRFEEGKPTWEGIVDVATAFILVVMSFVLHREAKNKMGERVLQISYGVATLLPTLMILGMWLYRDVLTWNVLLPGLAWRTWLILYTLPAVVAILSEDAGKK